MKLDFPSLNSLLHCVLTYLRGEMAVVPGAASIPKGTFIELHLTYPDGDEPVLVRGVSQGLDPAGRGLRLKLDNPQELDQVTMLLGHLHLGPFAARKLFDFSRSQLSGQPKILSAEPQVPGLEEDGPIPDVTEAPRPVRQSAGRSLRSLHSEEDRALLDKASAGFKEAKSAAGPPKVSPPRVRPPRAGQARTEAPASAPGRSRPSTAAATGSVPPTSPPRTRPPTSPPRARPPTSAPRARPPGLRTRPPAVSVPKSATRPAPVTSDRMPGSGSSPARAPSRVPRETVSGAGQSPVVSPGPGERKKPAKDLDLSQTQVVKIDDLSLGLDLGDDDF